MPVATWLAVLAVNFALIKRGQDEGGYKGFDAPGDRKQAQEASAVPKMGLMVEDRLSLRESNASLGRGSVNSSFTSAASATAAGARRSDGSRESSLVELRQSLLVCAHAPGAVAPATVLKETESTV